MIATSTMHKFWKGLQHSWQKRECCVVHHRSHLIARTRYAEGSRLAGILYIHRISDDRFTGASTRNFKMFRKLCGDPSLKNVILVTNMWGKVEKGVGEAHEKELTEVFFKAALD